MLNKKTILKIIKNGGATLDKNGNFKKFKKGFQCSVKDCYTINLKNIDEILTKSNKVFNTLKNDEYLGFWVNNNKIYIDISKKFDSLEFALIFGKINNQISILNWANFECITINKYFSNIA